jgi:hypothetical protein
MVLMIFKNNRRLEPKSNWQPRRRKRLRFSEQRQRSWAKIHEFS